MNSGPELASNDPSLLLLLCHPLAHVARQYEHAFRLNTDGFRAVVGNREERADDDGLVFLPGRGRFSLRLGSDPAQRRRIPVVEVQVRGEAGRSAACAASPMT